MNLRPLVPNTITLLSMACGIVSICRSWTGEPIEAGWWILYATLLDRVDGTVARALKATSALGAQLDSFSDFVAFGLAPAFLAFAACGGAFDLRVVVPMIVYVAACALRLARFGLAPEKKLFEGVASTMAGGVLAVAMIVALTHKLPQTALAAPVLLCVLAVAMNMPWLRYNKVGGGNSRVARYSLVGIALFCAVLILARALPEVLLAVTSTTMVFGPIATAWDQRAGAGGGMPERGGDARLVYSTDPALNRRCPRCRELAPECTCPAEVDADAQAFTAVLRIEKAGRAGKTVTVIDRLPKSEAFLSEWTTQIKKRCGTGGTYRMDRDDGVIEIQGDRREAIRELFAKEGIRSKG